MSGSSAFIGLLVALLGVALGGAVIAALGASRRAPVSRRLEFASPSRGATSSSGLFPTAGRRRGAERWFRLDRWTELLRRRRQEAALARGLPAAVDDIARSLRSGGSVRTALTEAAAGASPALATDLDLIVRACDQGIPLRAAIDRWADAHPTSDVRLAAAALVLGVDAGAGLARTLDGVATTLYERAAIAREVRALSTQARYSAGVLAVAPLVFLMVVVALDDVTLGFLLGTPAGLACLGIGLGLDVVGAWWMARITRRAW